MRILFFSHYFPSEVNAPALRTYEHCARWVKAGHDVTVVTCVPNCPDGKAYAGYRNRLLPQTETIDGIRVVRVWTYLAANAGTLRRMINFVSYFVSSLLASLRLARPDVVVATSPQFFCGWAGAWAARFKRVPFVLEIRDLWPESITAVGALRSRPLLRFLEFLEQRLYKAPAQLVTVGDGYQARILEKAHVADRISVITNGVDLQRFAAQPPNADFLVEFNLAGKFICSYVGTLGMAHGLEVVAEAARILKDQGRDDIRFCLVGDGAHRERLARRAAELGVESSVVFAGRQPADRVPTILASSDACLIHLKDCDLFETVLPSKMFEAMAMARPIILGVRGEARALLQQAGGGLEMEPDHADSLVACVTRLADDPALRAALGARGRAFVEEHFNRDRLAAEMLSLLETVADGARNARTLAARTADPDSGRVPS